MSQEDSRVVLARRYLLGTGSQAPPGNGSTITLFDSTAAGNNANLDCTKFNRIQVNITSSHDSGASGVVISSSFDQGTNFDTQNTYTYLTANGATTYDYLVRGGNVKVAYTNSANVLTGFRCEVVGIYDRNPGA